MYFYAVAVGRRPGVYPNWDAAEKEIKGFPNSKYQRFGTEKEAEQFIRFNSANNQKARNRNNNAKFKANILNVRDSEDPDPLHKETLVCFTDGSAISNGSLNCRAGWAAIFPHNESWNVSGKLSESKKTNNRAEYLAAIEAMRRANKEDPGQLKPLYIYSDSMLLIRSMTEWVNGWIRKGWRKSDGTPVLNKDLLEELVETRGKRRIIWRHVKAHTGKKNWESIWNDKADRFAQMAARS
ncbi:Ribonuclease H domain-containing protein [Rozella allomycis CSF55]|uniref:Ribonuclease H n=1 Tax=Rozella allomycis (strain CSF55) TaxID=988480 RepID=A0A075AN21_ROZAC|nr:Ribonuclease H domain-containing protein [Rozella allomycis CSF55]|eukprot:EPZ31103.1 Ribonuclease H domain-containing protein [Rozella allomycis CSF55]